MQIVPGHKTWRVTPNDPRQRTGGICRVLTEPPYFSWLAIHIFS